jgi:hypothetical protein
LICVLLCSNFKLFSDFIIIKLSNCLFKSLILIMCKTSEGYFSLNSKNSNYKLFLVSLNPFLSISDIVILLFILSKDDCNNSISVVFS